MQGGNLKLGRTGLQIVVHGDDVISFGVIHSRNRRVVLTGILRQLDDLYAGILIGQCLQLLKGCPFVRWMIVHQNEFVGFPIDSFHFLYGALHHFSDGVRRAITGNDKWIRHTCSSLRLLILTYSNIFMRQNQVITPERRNRRFRIGFLLVSAIRYSLHRTRGCSSSSESYHS